MEGREEEWKNRKGMTVGMAFAGGGEKGGVHNGSLLPYPKAVRQAGRQAECVGWALRVITSWEQTERDRTLILFNS
jgi:hypothetical protein